jgi:hypothetical protein
LRVRLAGLTTVALLLTPAAAVLAQGDSVSPAAPGLDVYNGTVSATAVHGQAGSSAFPNFASGAIDNRYPLAHVRLDSSPTIQVTASPLDTGPLGQTVAAGGQKEQPQYAEVRCPPQCDNKPVTVGGEPGPFASAQAADGHGSSTARAGGGPLGGGGGGAPAPPGPPAPPKSSGLGVPAAPADPVAAGPAPAPATVDPLRAALAAWRARYLTANDARLYPMPAEGAPDAVEGDAAHSEGTVKDGVLTLVGESWAKNISLGGGQIAIHGLHVRASVKNDGNPGKDIVIEVGSAEVGGVPVTIGPQGVSVKGQSVPGIGEGAAQANAALNQALAQSGAEMHAVAPKITTSDHQLTLNVVGLMVRFAPASPAPGVPAQFTSFALGEVFADSLAVPGTGANGGLSDGGVSPGLGNSVTGGTAADTAASSSADSFGSADTSGTGALAGDGSAFTSGSSGGFQSSSGGGTSTATGGFSSGRQAALTPARLVSRHKPTELLLLYLIWQVLVLGTAASLWLWRKEGVA